MKKEIIISMIIIVAIFLGNYVTQQYTSHSIEMISETLEELRKELIHEEVDKQMAEQQIEKLNSQWEEVHSNMAYYIEHNELEKVETDITSMKSLYETESYSEAISELDKSVFVLKHIEDKNAFNWQNIF